MRSQHERTEMDIARAQHEIMCSHTTGVRKSESGQTVEIRRLTLTEFEVLVDGRQVFSGRNKRAEVVAQWWLDGCQS